MEKQYKQFCSFMKLTANISILQDLIILITLDFTLKLDLEIELLIYNCLHHKVVSVLGAPSSLQDFCVL